MWLFIVLCAPWIPPPSHPCEVLSFSFNFPTHFSFFPQLEASKRLAQIQMVLVETYSMHISSWQTWIASKINNVKINLAICTQIAHAALTIRQAWFWSLVPHCCDIVLFSFGLLWMICKAFVSLTDRLTGIVMACLAHAQAWSWYAGKKKALPSMRLREVLKNKHKK